MMLLTMLLMMVEITFTLPVLRHQSGSGLDGDENVDDDDEDSDDCHENHNDNHNDDHDPDQLTFPLLVLRHHICSTSLICHHHNNPHHQQVKDDRSLVFLPSYLFNITMNTNIIIKINVTIAEYNRGLSCTPVIIFCHLSSPLATTSSQ